MRRLSVLALLLLAGACSSRSAVGSSDPGIAPALTIERFLAASSAVRQISRAQGEGAARMAEELETMARLFGTAEGSVLRLYPRDEVEQRMFLIARILDHTDYTLAGERAVPGRSRDEIQILVNLHTRNEGVKAVPFTVVRTSRGEWLIQTIDLERITGT